VGPFRIHDRIVVPFVLMALVAIVTAAMVSLSLISHTLEARVESQIANASAFVSGSQFALNSSVLRLVKAMVNADVVTYGRDRLALTTTLDQNEHQGLFDAVVANEPAHIADAPESAYQLREMTNAGRPYLVAYRHVADPPGTVIAFIAETSELSAALRVARIRILAVAGISLALLFLVSHLVARRVSAPIEQLLAFTKAAVPGTSIARAPVSGDDEVARLGRAFNDMLDRLETSQDALVRSEKLAVAGLLAARVAHDVRNPLSSIKMQTQLLRSRLQHDADNQALVRALLHDIDQVESVVRGLLELARPGELNLQRARLDIVVEDLLRHLAAQMAHRKIVVETKLGPHLPDVMLDPARFRQALLNVVVNATDAMTEGGTLSVVAETTGDRSSVILDVCDDGVGIDPAIAERVFDPFVSSKLDGIGLGLVNTKAIVESHGGTIQLSARQPRGTRARITLPAAA
jgi:signal transduction histidine kinase